MKDFGKNSIGKKMVYVIFISELIRLKDKFCVCSKPIIFMLDYPWAGSLKPVSNEMRRAQNQGRPGSKNNQGIIHRVFVSLVEI